MYRRKEHIQQTRDFHRKNQVQYPVLELALAEILDQLDHIEKPQAAWNEDPIEYRDGVIKSQIIAAEIIRELLSFEETIIDEKISNHFKPKK